MSHISTIIREFKELTKQAQATKENGWRFKINNYRKVTNILASLEATGTGDDVTTTLHVLELLRDGGMGFKGEKPPTWKSKILLKIDEIIDNGFLKTAEDSRNDPKTKALTLLTSIPEIGPSKAQDLYDAGITTLEQLQADPDLVNRKQQIGLRHYKELSERIPRTEMTQWYEGLTHLVDDTLTQLDIKAVNMELVGSYRRGHETSGDVDFYLALRDGEPLDQVMEYIKDALVQMGGLHPDDIFSSGLHKLMCVAKLGPKHKARHVDVFIFHEHQYPFAIMYATGSGDFNIRFRNHALQMGWSLSDKAICIGEAGGDPPSETYLMEKLGKSKITREEDIFNFLGIAYIKPEDRTPTVKFQLLNDITVS
jgi:DNA polymerase/3'-5' exonuclease PolX